MNKRILRMAAMLSMVCALVRPSLSESELTLDKCVREALLNNPDLQVAAENAKAALSQAGEARSAYYPWINAGISYVRTDNAPQVFMMSLNQRTLNMGDPAFNPNKAEDSENVRGTFGVQYRLYDFGRRGLDTKMADLGAEAGDDALRIARNELVHQVHRAFYGVLQARAFAAVQEEAVKSIEESLRVAQERFDSGSALKTDVLNLEVQLGQAKESLIRARNGQKIALAALEVTVGKEGVGDKGLAHVTGEIVAPPKEVKYEELIESRPELSLSRRMVELKNRAVKRTERDYLPTINLFGSFDWDSDPSDMDLESSYTAGVALDVNIFDGFRTRQSRRRALQEESAVRAEEKKTYDNLKLDAIQAYLGLNESWERLAVARKSVESAEAALKITRERYQGKAADITELLMAQMGVVGSQAREVAAQYDYMIARSNLTRAGGGWADLTAED